MVAAREGLRYHDSNREGIWMKRVMIWAMVSDLLFLAGAVFFAFGAFRYGQFFNWPVAIGILGVVVSWGVALTKVRCPFGRRYLGMGVSRKRRFCPWCGSNLEKEA